MTSHELREYGLGQATKNVDEQGLTPAQRRFLEAYCGEADFQPAKALELSGYKVEGRTRTALLKTATRILSMPASRKYLGELNENDPLVMGRQERLRRLSKIARGEPVSEVEGVKFPASIGEQLKAMEALGKASGEGQRIEITVRPEQLSDAELEAALLAMGRVSVLEADVVDVLPEVDE